MYLYIVVSGNGLFKIGKATNIRTRMHQIRSGSPVVCICLAAIEYNDMEDLEREYHTKFSAKRVRGEWFALSKDDLLSIIPRNDRVEGLEELLNEMHEWGLFTLGASELHLCGRAFPPSLTRGG